MKKVLLLSLVMIGAAHSALAANKSVTTKVTESVSSSSYSKVECSMEDYTCQKLILDMGRQEALSRVLSGENGKISVVLQQSISIVRQHDESAKDLSDAQIIEILASQQQ
ncbi:hypothetical protein [Bdellovibrio svalbardensis]|uniref:Uncharacterized protein n=1 Tax=Bdellovibrio svalbardensis TaxID=2972972 RepID=A0ABT6DNR1_9BACT|nr:hypothetical protein [Bdellovibrio svalbardensis]MDG0816768.1 hypothetical protein [Bdellovibrio svalbardensis]